MEASRAKVTKEVLCEEARFILANVMAEARYGRQNRYDDIRRVCEGAVSIPFGEYIGFLEKSGYLRHDHGNESLEVTPDGETVVNGGNLPEFTERAVSHFKKLRQSRAKLLEKVPEELVVDLVMILHFLWLHEGTKQTRASVCCGLFQISVPSFYILTE